MLYLADVVEDLTNRGDFVPLVAILGGFVVGIVAIVCAAARGMVVSRAREQTRREIAAYVAEGSISPEQGVALMNAGKSSAEVRSCCGPSAKRLA